MIAGIGHGHDGVFAPDADTTDIVANAAIVEFNRITEENIDSFHFHGDPNTYPVTGVIVVPDDARAGTILRGRYLDGTNPLQIVVPSDVVGRLVERIFRIKALLDAVTIIVGVAAVAAIGLALFLSYRLRAREMQTAFKIGARRSMVLRLLLSETLVLLITAGLISYAIVIAVQTQGATIITWLLAA